MKSLDFLIPKPPPLATATIYGTVTQQKPLQVKTATATLPVARSLVACTVGDKVTMQVIDKRLTIIGVKDGPKRTGGDFTVDGGLTTGPVTASGPVKSDSVETGPVTASSVDAGNGTRIDGSGNLYVQGTQVKPGQGVDFAGGVIDINVSSGFGSGIAHFGKTLDSATGWATVTYGASNGAATLGSLSDTSMTIDVSVANSGSGIYSVQWGAVGYA